MRGHVDGYVRTWKNTYKAEGVGEALPDEALLVSSGNSVQNGTTLMQNL